VVSGEERLARPPEEGYPGTAVAAAAAATLAFPLISLIVALVLAGRQDDERKRSQLRLWAGASGGLIVLWIVVATVLVGVGGGSGVDGGAVVTVVP
jgi:membrane-associated phospholipid phosphatase